MLKSKEQLTGYMIAGHIHLSRKDYSFFNNICNIIAISKAVTSNQDKLFNKLIAKYQRQLIKLGFNINELVNLQWSVKVLQTKQEYLDATISLNDNLLEIKSPFNTNFIQYLRKVDDNPFQWHKIEKKYKAPFSTFNLKFAYEAVSKHYESVKFCPQIEKLITYVKQQDYDKHYWDPTLVKIKNNFYIVSTNSFLHDAIQQIELNDDPKTLMLLSNHGVVISDEVFGNDPFKIFAGSYFVKADVASFTQISKWLSLLEVDHVFTASHLVYTNKITNDIKVDLLADGITCSPVGSTDHKNGILLRTSNSLPFKVNMKKISKIVHLINSTPVNIK